MGLISLKKRSRTLVATVDRRMTCGLPGRREEMMYVASEAAAALTRVLPMRWPAS